MPLRDHFHLPLRGQCTGESFHSGWANEIVRRLNRSLPTTYVARPNVRLGVDIEADVGTMESRHEPAKDPGGVATAVWAWTTDSCAANETILGGTLGANATGVIDHYPASREEHALRIVLQGVPPGLRRLIECAVFNSRNQGERHRLVQLTVLVPVKS